MNDKTVDDVRLCLALLIGMSYGSKTIRDQLKATSGIRDYWPADLRQLLEAIESEDGLAVRTWFSQRAVVLPDGRLPDALGEYMAAFHRTRLANDMVGDMCRAAQLSPSGMLAGLKKLVAKLEEAGIQAKEPG